MKASTALANGYGWCVPKAALLAAACRAAGIPARVGYADVRNHLSTERLRQNMGSDLFVWHGYTDIWLDGQWLKATPAFNIELCDRFGLLPLEFDGRADSIYHPFDTAGNRHMEYVTMHGSLRRRAAAAHRRRLRACTTRNMPLQNAGAKARRLRGRRGAREGAVSRSGQVDAQDNGPQGELGALRSRFGAAQLSRRLLGEGQTGLQPAPRSRAGPRRRAAVAPWLIRTTLRLVGLHARGQRNALDIQYREHEVRVARLPSPSTATGCCT